jgi:hypothetical protein
MRGPGDGLSRLGPFHCSLNAIVYDILLAGSYYKKYFANMGVSCNLPSEITVTIYIFLLGKHFGKQVCIHESRANRLGGTGTPP